MGLKRVLGAGDAAWIVAGNMFGAGIFIMPGVVAGRLPGVAWPLAAWALGGVISLCGAAVYAELGARLPRAGGDYPYLSEAFGPLWGFLTGWAALTLTFSAAAAVMALVVVEHLRTVVPALAEAPPALVRTAAAGLVLLMTWANVAGARISGRTTMLLTALPIAGLALLYGAGLLAGRAEVRWPAEPALASTQAWTLSFGAAMIPVFFTYSGWNAAAYVASEIKDAPRSLAWGLLVGTGAITVVYLLVNLVLLLAVPPEELAGSTTAGAQAARRLLGPWAEGPLALVIAGAVLGSANVTLMAGARIYYAMALDGLAPRALGTTNAAGVPSAALWVGGTWAALLSLTGKVDMLLSWSTLAILVFSSMAVAALFVLRSRDPAVPAYRCPGYPLTPIVYLVTSLVVAGASAIREPRESLYGTLFVAAGVPLYFWFRKRGQIYLAAK